jgi:hypothetical protein
MMGRAIGAWALAMLLAGCGQAASTATPLVQARPSTLTAVPDVTALLARPLKLPTVQSSSRCPVTTVASRNAGVADPPGRGPFYLGGAMPQGNFAWNKTVWVLVDGTRGPVLFRGGRIDGPGSLKFRGTPADPSDIGVSLSTGEVTATFYERVIDPGAGDAFYVYPSTIGCYALQVDGSSFEDVVVVSAR